jgi:hypothetical protein
MRWILGVVAVLACVICGLLGLTAGINLNPNSTTKYVPNWGSLGDWISGVGAMLAVVSSFILVRRNEAAQDDREREKISVEQWASDFFLSIRVISTGHFPCTINGVFFESPSGRVVSLAASLPSEVKVQIPHRLESRSDMNFGWTLTQMGRLLGALSLLDLDRVEDLSIYVVTSIAEHRFPIGADVSNMLIGIARAEGIQLLKDETEH